MPDKPTSHDTLLKKMDALVGRHRAETNADPDEIPVLTQVVSNTAAAEQPAPSASMPHGTTSEPPNAVAAPDLSELIESHLHTMLKQQLSDQLQAQLRAQIDTAVREVLERESDQLARRIAARVRELLRERLG